MKHLSEFVREYHAQFNKVEVFDESITGQIEFAQSKLLADEFNPSIQLRALFNKLLRRSKYPMEVAIIGQFSSGKSTFLNALLSRDILPTGITPVTSKVNYINYSNEYKLKITYNNGAHEYHPLESISRFTDQRESIEDIKYLTLYAPMDILKDISFVDTPGLNSQSVSDTNSTKKILRDVDGIIWLTLIDNAGKESESEILESHLKNFRDKSLCVLNQKDKFSSQDIQTAVDYMGTKFSSFFTKIVPISAKEALESRIQHKQVLKENALQVLQNDFKSLSAKHVQDKDLDFFSQSFYDFTENIQAIDTINTSDNRRLLASSNINEVLEFINDTIRPQAQRSKAYAIQQDLLSICDILQVEYTTIKDVYTKLEDILKYQESDVLNKLDDICIKNSQAVYMSFDKYDLILESIAKSIYENVKPKETTRYENTKTIFGKKKINAISFETVVVDHENVMQTLFYEAQYIDKQIKSAIGFFKNIEHDSTQDFKYVFSSIKQSVKLWQEPYEHLYKHREIASDIEFSKTRQFVAKVYENILLPYHQSTLERTSELHSAFTQFESKIGTSYKQITRESIFLVQEKIDKQVQMYMKKPLKHTVSSPSYESILDIVKENFNFDKMGTFLTSRRNYLFKIVEQAKEEFVDINNKNINYIKVKKQPIIEKIQLIEELKDEIKSKIM